MVDAPAMTNGDAPARELPEAVVLSAVIAKRIPSPGTQRALKAETGRSFDELCGEEADGADRIQTIIWMQLRRTIPDLRWAECEDIWGIPEEEAPPVSVDPSQPSASENSPPSVASGG